MLTMRIPSLLRAVPVLCALIAVSVGAAPNPLGAPQPAAVAAPLKPSELFKSTTVWTVHLQFTPQQWEAIEPKAGEGIGRGFRGPGGMAGVLAPGFLKDGDLDHDSKLSKDEFGAMAEKWFTQWDVDKSGKLNAEQLRIGMTAAMNIPSSRLQGAPGTRNGLASAAGVEFVYVHADLEFAGQTVRDVGVRYKGNGTWMNSQGSLKHSFKVDLNHFVEGQKFAGVGKLNFHNNVTDASFMNEVLSHRLYRDAGVPAPRSAYARVYVTVPGTFKRQYFGLYSIVEDMDKHFMHEILGARDGAIFKPVTPHLFGDMGDDWEKYKQTYDPKTDLTEAQIRRVIDFARLVTRASDAEFAAKLGDFLDLDEFARYMSVTVWLSTLDSILAMGQNFYVYLDPKSNKFQFLPWDLDHSFGQFPMGGREEQRENLSIAHPWKGENRFLERVFKVEAFKKLYLAKFEEFDKTIFVPDRFFKQVDEFAAAIRPSVKEESRTMLERLDTVVAGEPVESDGRFGGRGGEVKPIKGFVTARAQSVLAQVAGKSQGMTLGEGGRSPFGGPGTTLGTMLLGALDANRDGAVSHEEFIGGFAKWFSTWNMDKSGLLTLEQLRAGIGRDLTGFRGGGRGFGAGGR